MTIVLNLFALVGAVFLLWAWLGNYFGDFRGHDGQFLQAGYIIAGAVFLVIAAAGWLVRLAAWAVLYG